MIEIADAKPITLFFFHDPLSTFYPLG